MEELFQPSLETIDTLMREQVYYAISNNIGIDKVVLAGGFGDSPALKEYLTNSLQSINNSEDKNMRLVCTPTHKSATGVAKGALMRAMNKDHGPKRIPVQSIGILHHVSDDPAKYPDEVLQQTDWDENDVTGEWYIMNTIQWLIKVVSHLLDQHPPLEKIANRTTQNQKEEFKPVHTVDWIAMHPFQAKWPSWIAEHKLYVSDTCTEDFYTRRHVKNRGKTTELVVQFDLTYVRDAIRAQSPEEFADEKNYTEVNIRVRLTIIDRNLEFTAYWPADDTENAKVIRGSQMSVNVVSAFRPGTG
jgi:hypothetical protein